MSTIQIVLEDELLAEADAQAARDGRDRSELIRSAIRDHLRRLRTRELEEQERLGYERIPDTVEDGADWEKLFACPEDVDEVQPQRRNPSAALSPPDAPQ